MLFSRLFAQPATRRPLRPAAPAADVLEARQLLSAVPLTAAEQYFVELINRARVDPTAEAALQDTPLNEGFDTPELTGEERQILATHNQLAVASELHTLDMLDRDFFAHNAPDSAASPAPNGVTPTARVQDQGYDGVAGAENLAYRGSTGPVALDTAMIDTLHADLWKSKGHRKGMLVDDSRVRELGVGIAIGEFTNSGGQTFNAALVTEKFGLTNAGRTYITGVIYDDADSGAENNEFYNIGEGMSGGSIVAIDVETGERFTGGVNSVGGYNIQIDQDATYDVVLTQDGQAYTVQNVSVADWNVKLDFDFDEVSADPPPAPTFDGRAIVRIDGSTAIWSLFDGTEWHDATADLGGESINESVSGDFDGDGDLDLAISRGDAGRWDLLTREGLEGTLTVGWRNFGTGTFEQPHAGDFDGNGTADLAVYNTDNGHWMVALDSGLISTWQVLGQDRAWVNSRVGDFDGDGVDDIAIQENAFGQWYFMTSNRSRFVTTSWGDAVNIQIQYSAIERADVDGDGKDELLMLNAVTGYWLVGFVGQEATFETWARWTTEAAWQNVVVGDFDGDGRDDIAAQTGTPTGGRDGVWYVALSVINENATPAQTRGQFVGQKWADRWNPDWQITQFAAADVDGDGLTDLVGRSAANGSFLVGKSTGASPVDDGDGFEFGTLAGLDGANKEIDLLIVGTRVQPVDPVLPADA